MACAAIPPSNAGASSSEKRRPDKPVTELNPETAKRSIPLNPCSGGGPDTRPAMGGPSR